jgi:sarcosine oxidase, subunit beta
VTSPRVCIVGAGVIGLESALQLARRGVTDVTVLEAAHVAAGSSGLSVGIVESQYLDPLEIELRVRALRAFDALEREHGLTIVRNGYLRLGHDAADAARFQASVDVHRSLGIDDVRVLDAAEIAQLVPEIRADDIEAGLYGPSSGFVDGHSYCALLAQLAAAAGVRVLLGCPLQEARVESGQHVLRTPAGEHVCDYVVNAAGAWAERVGRLLGGELPLLPQRHQATAVHLARPLAYLMPSVMDYTPRSGEEGLYFRHERAGQLIAGLHSEEAVEGVADPDGYARSVDADFLEGVAEKLASRLPALADSTLAHGWAGLYPVSPDGLPQIGPPRGGDTVISAGGAGGAGIQQAPVLGELVADWILHGEPRAISDGMRLSPRRGSIASTRD